MTPLASSYLSWSRFWKRRRNARNGMRMMSQRQKMKRRKARRTQNRRGRGEVGRSEMRLTCPVRAGERCGGSVECCWRTPSSRTSGKAACICRAGGWQWLWQGETEQPRHCLQCDAFDLPAKSEQWPTQRFLNVHFKVSSLKIIFPCRVCGWILVGFMSGCDREKEH